MQTQDRLAKLALAVTSSLLLSLSALAADESDAVRATYISAANVPTNIPGVRTYAEPPKGFNPVMATDKQLATYGFPPRPNQQAEPDHYALWERVMRAANIRWHGELKPLPVSRHETIPAHSSPLPQEVQPQTSGPKQITILDASGVILTNKETKWSAEDSFSQVGALMSVSVAQAPSGAPCSSDGPWDEFSLVGIDGFIYLGSSDGYPLMKPGFGSGVLSFGSCASNGPYQPYALYGDFRVGEGDVAFKVNPGDVVFAYAEVLNPDEGYVFVEDLTLQTYHAATISVTPSLVGQNAAWTVSRLVCPGPPFSGCSPNTGPDGETPLANTANIFFGGALAQNSTGSKSFYPGSQSTSTLIMTMMDDGFNQAIETVNQGTSGYEGLHSLLFTTTGCARVGGCTP
jgi:hypothetical protein